MWACTLAMARPYHAKTCGLSLAKLVEHYQLGVKDNTALIKTQGKRLKDFTPDEIRAMSAYNTADTDQCFQLFKILLTKTPRDELRIIDSCIRMLVEPVFELDVDLLTDTLAKEKQRKRDTVLKLARFLGVDGIDAQEEVTNTLASAPKFSALLEQLGVEVPMKPSPTDPDKLIPALAKTDQGMLDLLESDNEIVAAAAEARLGVKSTLLETRIQKFLESAAACGGRLPIPVKYYGADTTGRLSGWSYNPLNLPRINPYEPKLSDALRKSMRAPKGFKVVVADLSGIELRVNLTLWKVPYALDLYAENPEADLYKPLASEVLGIPMESMTKMARQAGKAMHLGCGFGLGSKKKYIAVAKQMAQIDVTEDEAGAHIAGYRAKHPEVVRGWRVCHQALSSIYAGSDDTVDPWHMISTTPEGFKTPRGFILYPELRQEVDEKSGKVEWKYGAGRHTARIYAGKVTENCLAANTLVLTRCGWKPIVEVQPADMLWDGTQWVRHAGVVPMGVKPVMDFGGVSITPDHKVLINDEWVEARAASYRQAASSYKGPGGVPDPHAGSGRLRGERRAENALARSLRLRRGEVDGVQRSDERHQVLRVQSVADDQHREPYPRDDKAPGVPSVEVHEAALHHSDAQSVEKLRRPGYPRMRRMAGELRKLLARHGGVLRRRTGTGSKRQQRGLLPGKLSLGYSTRKHAKQEILRVHQNPLRADARMGRRGSVGVKKVHAILPPSYWRSGGKNVRPSKRAQKVHAVEVFDVLNCGPLNRFTVKSAGGNPFIVHNCVQHLARSIINDHKLAVRKATGRLPAMEVYDELVYVVPEAEAESHLTTLLSVMRTPPTWWPELVLWVEGDIADTYGDAK